MFIVIDGIDGSGKDTVLDTWVDHLASEGKRIFNLKDYWQQHKEHPSVEQLDGYDVLVSTEPTYAWVGAAIRNELVHKDKGHDPKDIADAFALDRMILHKRLIIPAKKKGMLILQARSVSSSLAYQTIHGDLTPEHIASIPGNAFALQHAADALVIADLHPNEAMQRLSSRIKDDNAVFEKKDFLEKAHAQYHSDWFKEMFENRGTRIHYFSTSDPIDIMKTKAIDHLKQLLN